MAPEVCIALAVVAIRRERRVGVLTAFRVGERGRFLEETEESGGGRLVGGVKVVGGSSCFLSSTLSSIIMERECRFGCGIGRLLKGRFVKTASPNFLKGCLMMAVRETEEGGMGSSARKWLTGRPLRLNP